MRVAFYSPMKPPDDPVPSGDRRMARLLIRALELAGHEVEVAARLRSRDAAGNPLRQARLGLLGYGLVMRVLRRYEAQPAEALPQAWMTYHLYYKAPDYIGPLVATALGIPYLVVEASLANKRAQGPWALGHKMTLFALEQAAAVISLNPVDSECLPEPARVRPVAPFLDAAPFAAAAARRDRAALAARHGLAAARPWLLAVAMMRAGDKLASYRLLAQALGGLGDRDWQLAIAGDGPCRGAVEAAFGALPPGRVRFLGQLDEDQLPALYAACDLLVWPAINEAYGMALLEAQAAGLPVVAGRSGGVGAVVCDGETGVLTAPGDAAAFARATAALLDDPARRAALSRAALRRVAEGHDLRAAADRLDGILAEAVRGVTALVVLRHGATAWNAAGRIQGSGDPPLSAAGRRAVRAWRLPPGLAEEMADGGAWLSSPLARARETALLLHPASAAAALRIEAALTEMDWGAWEGQRLAELRAAEGAAMAANEARGLDFRPPGGESPREVQARLAPLLRRLARERRPALAVTHKGVLRALYASASGWDMTGRPPERLCEGCAHRFRLDARGRPGVERLNLPLVP